MRSNKIAFGSQEYAIMSRQLKKTLEGVYDAIFGEMVSFGFVIPERVGRSFIRAQAVINTNPDVVEGYSVRFPLPQSFLSRVDQLLDDGYMRWDAIADEILSKREIRSWWDDALDWDNGSGNSGFRDEDIKEYAQLFTQANPNLLGGEGSMNGVGATARRSRFVTHRMNNVRVASQLVNLAEKLIERVR